MPPSTPGQAEAPVDTSLIATQNYDLFFDFANDDSDKDPSDTTSGKKENDPNRLLFKDLRKESSFKPLVAAIPGVRKYMRVALKETQIELAFKTEGRVDLWDVEGKDSTLLTNIRGSFIVRRNGNELEILHPDRKFWGNANHNLVIRSHNSKNLLEFDKQKYRGHLEIQMRLNGELMVINQLQLEDYIRGVLPYEMPASDKAILEALKAQAVAARTYALSHQNQFPKEPFDVYADTRDQVYKGVTGETFLSDKAVMETNNIVLVYKGKMAACYYHSTCGGRTANLHEVWFQQDSIHYLVSRNDIDSTNGKPYCKASKFSHWFEKWDKKKLAGIIESEQEKAKALNPHAFKQILNLSIADTSRSGRVRNLDVKTEKGTISIRGDKTRWALKRDMPGNPILLSSHFRILKQDDEVLIEGKGFGHGIGMCQMGAMERARQGTEYSDILFAYYAGTNLILLE